MLNFEGMFEFKHLMFKTKCLILKVFVSLNTSCLKFKELFDIKMGSLKFI